VVKDSHSRSTGFRVSGQLRILLRFEVSPRPAAVGQRLPASFAQEVSCSGPWPVSSPAMSAEVPVPG
jgi:hypothetical protein